MTIYSADDLPEFSVSFPFPGLSSLLPHVERKSALIIDNGPNNPRAKAIIEGDANHAKLLTSEAFDCDWYRSVGDIANDEWEFVGRYPIQINFKSTGDAK